MCRLFAFHSRIDMAVHRSLLEAENALAKQSRIHSDGWGIAYYQGTALNVVKNADAAFNDHGFEAIGRLVSSRTVIAHIRKATVGPPDPANCHPFSWNGWCMAHNGQLADFERTARPWLLGHTDPDLRGAIGGQTDSEHLFFFLMSRIRRAGLTAPGRESDAAALRGVVREALRDVLAHVPASDANHPTKINLVLSNGRISVVSRVNEPIHYSTYKRDCAQRASCPAVSPACFAGVDGIRTHLLVASEPLSHTEDVWREMPDHALLSIDPEMIVRIEPLAGFP